MYYRKRTPITWQNADFPPAIFGCMALALGAWIIAAVHVVAWALGL